MRLIDADALMETIRAHEYPLKSHFNSTDRGMFTIGIQQAVDEQPTIAASPWHRVQEELPPPNKTVLVCKIWRDVNGDPHKVITMDSFTISPSDSVIAWMPLPEPPKEDA